MAGRRNGRRYAKDEDFEEGEIWGVMEDNNKEMKMVNSSSKVRKPIKDSTFFTTSSSSPRVFTAPRMIPRSSSSEVFTAGNNINQQQSSAPVDIPDWSKIYGKTSKKKNNNATSTSPWVNNSNYNNNINNNNNNNITPNNYYNSNNNNNVVNDDVYCYGNGMGHHHHHGNGNGYGNGDGDGHHHHHHHHHHHDEDDDEDDDGMVPPHEYLARKLARNQISSFSVYEGIGRTLKGRDLSKVRNTILSKTGFLESS